MTTELEQKWIESWMKFSTYLSDEKLDGKTIFTLSFQNGCEFIIHPEGKDGNTLDLTLCFDVSLNDKVWLDEKKKTEYPFGSWGYEKNKIDEKFNTSSVRYPITIDNEPFIVKQIITMTQLKRIVGADNSYYKMTCINKPEHWKGQDPIDDEPIDLGSIAPSYYNLNFRCIRKP